VLDRDFDGRCFDLRDVRRQLDAFAPRRDDVAADRFARPFERFGLRRAERREVAEHGDVRHPDVLVAVELKPEWKIHGPSPSTQSMLVTPVPSEKRQPRGAGRRIVAACRCSIATPRSASSSAMSARWQPYGFDSEHMIATRCPSRNAAWGRRPQRRVSRSGPAIVGDEVREVREHDVVYVPPMESHQFVNRGGERSAFCIVLALRNFSQCLSSAEIEHLQNTPAGAYIDPDGAPPRAR